MKFKVGDVVRIKNLEFLKEIDRECHSRDGHPYGDVVFSKMYQYAGEVVTIRSVDNARDYQILRFHHTDWNWDSRWVELPVTKEGNTYCDDNL